MKKRKIILLTVVLFISAVAIAQLWKGKTLSTNQVLKKWGNKTYIEAGFKTGSAAQKAEMAYQILSKKNKYIGIDVDEVRKIFGSPDGFYFIDSYPAYILQEGKSYADETWQIVFLLNAEYKVRDVIVHKNCCD